MGHVFFSSHFKFLSNKSSPLFRRCRPTATNIPRPLVRGLFFAHTHQRGNSVHLHHATISSRVLLCSSARREEWPPTHNGTSGGGRNKITSRTKTTTLTETTMTAALSGKSEKNRKKITHTYIFVAATVRGNFKHAIFTLLHLLLRLLCIREGNYQTIK